MKTSRSLLVSLGALALLAACGPTTPADKCENVTCPAGTGCDESDGQCRAFAGGGAGGNDAGQSCVTAGCGSEAPICDTIAQVCRVCTPSKGCGGTTPICDTGSEPRKCVQCLESSDCSLGQLCSPVTHTCQISEQFDGGNDAGVDGGNDDGGENDGGDTDGGVDGGGSTGDGGWNGTGSCAPHDAGVASCTTECDRGFSCVNGQCVLNGAGGAVQITLRWNTIEDLDLHVDEPLPGGGTCEIYYSDPNDVANGNPSSCGAVGSLDLDSEAGCPSPPDNVDVENIIYPSGTPAPSGTYTVRVDHYTNCDPSLTMVPFELEVRNNGVISGVCGVFQPTDPDWSDMGNAGAGRTVMTFIVP